VKIPVIEVITKSGPTGQGRSVDGDIRSFLRLTYLKPLRDAKSEMNAGRGSRLSQLLRNYKELLGQDADSDLPPAETGKQQAPPPTLRGIISTTNNWIVQSPAIVEAKRQLNTEYLKELSLGDDKLIGEISIGREDDLRRILEKLDLWLTKEGVDEHTPHGLGMNNLLFMAAELLLLSQSAETGLPLLLVEEPEAHIHPQLQLRLMTFLDQQTNKGDVQAVLTTHSPILASHAKLENVVVMYRGQAFPVGKEFTKLSPGDYRFLEKFLDATKANLFFARGVLIVEGDAENLLLPIIADLIGLSFSKYGVSVVNVGHRGLFRYARIFQRSDGRTLDVPVACISDRDVPPDTAKIYIGTRATESEMKSDGKLEKHLAGLKKYDGGVVKTFVSEQWTLEYDLALSGLASELHKAIATSRLLKENTDVLDPKKVLEAEAAFIRDTQGLTGHDLASFVFQPLYEKDATKTETAQQLASLLVDSGFTADQLRAKPPKYLVDALYYVTGATAPAATV